VVVGGGPCAALQAAQDAQQPSNNKEAEMAKGQQKSNREIRKPKKSAAAKGAGPAMGSVSAAFAKPAKGDLKQKKR
jgi:hypothetical protein